MGKIYYETLQQRKADLPLTNSFLQVNPSGLIVSTVKAAEDRKGSYIIRLLNVTAEEIQGTLTFDRSVLSAQQVNLDEQPLAKLAVSENAVTITANPKQIVTIDVIF